MNSNSCTQKHKAGIKTRKNEIQGKDKSTILKLKDKANRNQDKGSPEPETCLSLEVGPVIEEANPSPKEIMSNPDIEIDLAPD